MHNRAKVELIFTGGTFGMQGNVLEPGDYATELLTRLPEYVGIVEVETFVMCNLDSSDMGPAHWSELALHIAEMREDFAAFIIIHGTDTLAYTASALSFALEGLDRPVILTAAQRPLGQLRNDARRNLSDALELTRFPIPEVGICFDGALYRGNRASKVNSRAYHAFDSPGFEPLARLGVDIQMGNHILTPVQPFRCLERFDDRVMLLNLFPGIRAGYVEKCIEAAMPALRGIVIVPFGVGTIPVRSDGAIGRILSQAYDAGVDIIAANASIGSIDFGRYENSLALRETGAISGGEMRVEAALTKLMHALAYYDDRVQRRDYLMWEVAGEGASGGRFRA